MSTQPRVHIGRDELLSRQDALRRAADGHGWPGVAVMGRSGGTYDRHGDLWWLCGHYDAYPYLHDRPPLWSGRAHAVLVVPVDGPSTLLCPTPRVGPDAGAERVRPALADFAAEAAGLLESIRGGGLAGLDAVPAPMAKRLDLEHLARADEVVELLRRQKSPAELIVVRRACAIGTAAVEALMDAARPGAKEGEAVGVAASVVYGAGAALYLLALATGERAAHYAGRPLPGFRAERVLEAGDVARLDLVLVYEGYYCDFGRTWVVGGRGLRPDVDALVDVLQDALAAATAAARPGAPAGAVAQAGAAALPNDVRTGYPPHWGHGLGLGWEGPWLLADADEALVRDQTLAIEVTLERNGATAAAEQDVLVGEGGPEVLTPARWTT